MGYGATNGASYIQGYLSDRIMTPADLAPYYSEKLFVLPVPFYVTSYKVDAARQDDLLQGHAQQVSQSVLSNEYKNVAPVKYPTIAELNAVGDEQRHVHNIPRDAMVMASFNQLHKTGTLFWNSVGRILAACNNSLLWTMGSDPPAAAQAILRILLGAGAGRHQVVFTQNMDIKSHLLRHGLADVFIDNPRYNGGTTGTDAVWSGVPILTLPLNKFAARYGASHSIGIGFPQFVARNWEDFVAVGRRFACNRSHAVQMKHVIRTRRQELKLFDSQVSRASSICTQYLN
jgi:predicted O-linked N-acetylglucosamine transferase (SPINDLY family)